MTEYINIPIDIDDFDYHYYLKNNNDLVRANIINLIQSYTHWLNYGCYENRKVRSLKTGKELVLNLNKNQKLIKINKHLSKLEKKEIKLSTSSSLGLELDSPNFNILKSEILNDNNIKLINKRSEYPKFINPKITYPKLENPKLENHRSINPKLDIPKLPNSKLPNSKLPNSKLANSKLDIPKLDIPKLPNPKLANPKLANPRLANPRLANNIIEIEHTYPIKLIKPFALLIHIYNAKYMSFFTKNIQLLYSKYTKDSFDIFINIVYISNKQEVINNENMIIEEELKKIYKPVVIYSENKGGDIGGFLQLCKLLDLDKYNGIIFCHSKTKDKWRIDLCSSIFNYKYSNDELNFGLLGNTKWIHTIDPQKNKSNYEKFNNHFVKLFKIYDFNDYLESSINKKYSDIKKWEFIAGTMFIANIKIIKYIIDHDIDYVYSLLNRLDSVDDNWLRIIKEMKLDNRGCGNDLCYRVKFGKPLLADFMIEHAFERLIGLICAKLNLTIKHDTFNTFQWGHSLF
jgi:hypothetical protein